MGGRERVPRSAQLGALDEQLVPELGQSRKDAEDQLATGGWDLQPDPARWVDRTELLKFTGWFPTILALVDAG